MLSEKKIKIMIKLAEYEQSQGKTDFRIGKYYKGDFVRFQVLKTFLCVTISYIIGLMLYVLYRFEVILGQTSLIGYRNMGIIAGVIYLMILFLYIMITIAFSAIKYDKTRKRLKHYYHYLKVLSNYYQDKEK